MTQFITPVHIDIPALCPKGLYILLYSYLLICVHCCSIHNGNGSYLD